MAMEERLLCSGVAWSMRLMGMRKSGANGDCAWQWKKQLLQSGVEHALDKMGASKEG